MLKEQGWLKTSHVNVAGLAVSGKVVACPRLSPDFLGFLSPTFFPDFFPDFLAQLLDAVPLALAERDEERRYVVCHIVVTEDDVTRDEVTPVGECDGEVLLSG